MSIDERISEALRRLVAGMGAMRIPADPCDADLVLSDVQTELATLRTQLATVTRERDERQKALEVALEERTSALAERNWANERHDEARADASRLREALEAVVEHFVGVDHHRDDCPGHLDHDGLTVLGPLCRDHQVSGLADAALASAPSAEPTPRDMRVAEAVREACVETADASDEASRRVAGDLRDLDLAAVVAKVVGA